MADSDSDYLDEIEPDVPPEPIQVAQRALILSAVVCRANIELYLDEEVREMYAEKIHEWLSDLDLWAYLEPRELEIINSDFGELRESVRAEGTWYAEGLALLGWALQCCDFPAHDHKVNAFQITGSLDFLFPEASAILTNPNLRSQEQIQAAREWYYSLHCGLRQVLHHHKVYYFPTWIDDYLHCLEIDPGTVKYENGIGYAGNSLSEIDRDELDEWEYVIHHRHRASIWLVGTYESYTELPVDT